MLNLVAPSQALDLDFQPLTLEALEKGKEMVRSNDVRGTVIFINSVGKRAIHSAHWSRGLNAEYQEMMFPCPCNESKSERILNFDGAPVYINDLNQTLEENSHSPTGKPTKENPVNQCCSTVGTNIWFFVMAENNLHGMTPAALDSGLFVTRSTLLPDGSTVVYHVTMPMSIALGSVSCLAVIKNVAIPVSNTL